VRIPSLVLIALVAVTTAQCSKPEATPASAAPAAPAAPAMWGELKPLVSVKELMHDMIDPLSDSIFDAVGSEYNGKGFVEVAPKSGEDWEKVRFGAVSMAEAIELLKVPRPLTPPGDENVSSGPNPPELSPAQIKAKIEKDPVVWQAKIQALRNVALEVIDEVDKKDTAGLFAAGGDMDQACEGCHLVYWYPGEDKRREQRREAALESLRKKK